MNYLPARRNLRRTQSAMTPVAVSAAPAGSNSNIVFAYTPIVHGVLIVPGNGDRWYKQMVTPRTLLLVAKGIYSVKFPFLEMSLRLKSQNTSKFSLNKLCTFALVDDIHWIQSDSQSAMTSLLALSYCKFNRDETHCRGSVVVIPVKWDCAFISLSGSCYC